MKFLVVFSCLLAVALAKPGHLFGGHGAIATHGALAAHGFGYSSVTAHAPAVLAAPAIAHHAAIAAPAVSHAAIASPAIATHSAIAHPASLVHHGAYAAPIAVAHAAPAAIAHHAAYAHHAALAAPVSVAHAAPATIAHHTAYAAPAAFAHSAAIAPVAAAVAPVAIEKTQYHAQDILGQASYGHAEAFQQHHAVQDAAGNKVGSYSWVAPDGQVVAGKYVADALGYRVHSNAVPVGPAPIVDTPEVVAARSAHFAAHIAAKTHHHLVL